MFIQNTLINCFCYPPDRCESYGYRNSTCVTNSGCYTARDIINDTEYITSGCFSNDIFQMKLTCGVKSDETSSILCCNNKDFCNRIKIRGGNSLVSNNPNTSLPSSVNTLISYARNNFSNLSTEAIFVTIIASSILFFCVLIFLVLISLNLRRSKMRSCRYITASRGTASQNSNMNKFKIKPQFFDHKWDVLSSMHCHHLLKICGKDCFHPSLSNLPQMDVNKNSANNHHVLSTNSSSCIQKPIESATGFAANQQTGGTMSSGSGSGVPFLVQATVARQISLQECIGKGRYGEVWRGVYRGENVAVKIFSSRDEASWARETHIYSSVLLRHENILGYYASDITSRYGCTQLWIISHYHPYGSLYDFLQVHVVDTIAAIRLAKTAAAGLCYLHSCILGLRGKPAIAHRDIKSKNILVQANGTCSIGDLGLAVMQAPGSTEMDIGRPNHKVGTKRYMAPEILAEENLEEFPESCEGILPNDFEISVYLQSKNRANYAPPITATLCFNFEELKAADVYAFGLVLWEIFRRCLTDDNEVYPPYVPYWDKVSSDPSFAEMRQVVHMEGQRPPISEHWMRSKILSRCAILMQECWHAVPNVRLPILRVKKTLDDVFFEAVNEIDRGQDNLDSMVLIPSKTPRHIDSGMNSRCHGDKFQFSSVETPYYQAIANRQVRSPREVLALGRIIRWPSMSKTEDNTSSSKSVEAKAEKVNSESPLSSSIGE